MIKNLLEQDEYKPEETEREPTAAVEDKLTAEEFDEPRYIEVNEAETLFDSTEAAFEKLDNSERLSQQEIESLDSFVETAGDMPQSFDSAADSSENAFVETPPETKESYAPPIDSPDNSINEAINETTNETANFAPPVEIANERENSGASDSEIFSETYTETSNSPFSVETSKEAINFDSFVEAKKEESKPAYNNDMLFQPLPEPESFSETARKSGLAYAAAITLTASIVFMLVIGWFADLLFGSSPWGIVGGIILGSLIGFVQFFRMTAQIFKNKE